MRAFPSQLRATLVTRDDKQYYEVEGYASVFERAYEMYDMFGAYMEIMDYHAFDKSMANSPDVAFLVNHKGVTMARTNNGTLELSTDTTGLKAHAFLNADRQDVKDFASAIRDGLVDEMSFAFMLNGGTWTWADENPGMAMDEFRITEADINRGDVSGVNYGANPYTSIQARAAEWIEFAKKAPEYAKRWMIRELSKRDDAEYIEFETAARDVAQRKYEQGMRAAPYLTKIASRPAESASESVVFDDASVSTDLAGQLFIASFGE
jgi:HK97 family phage prohead protease